MHDLYGTPHNVSLPAGCNERSWEPSGFADMRWPEFTLLSRIVPWPQWRISPLSTLEGVEVRIRREVAACVVSEDIEIIIREMDAVASDLVAAFEMALEGELQAVVQPAIARVVASFSTGASL